MSCRFCPRRLDCPEHWLAGPEVRPDALEGRVLALQAASTGTIALQLQSDDAAVWVTQLRQEHLPANLDIGEGIRLTGLRRVQGPGSS